MKLSRSEALMLLYLVEAYLPQAEPDELPTLEALLEGLQALSPAAPFHTATESRNHAYQHANSNPLARSPNTRGS